MDQAVFDLLYLEGIQVEKLNTTPPASLGSLARLLRISTFWGVWMRLLGSDLTKSRVYLALSGGWGQMYDVVTVLIGRVKGAQCILHHHSMAYLGRRSLLTSILFLFAGRNVVHVALCEAMKKRLEQNYGCRQVYLLSNISLVSPDVSSRQRDSLKTIGYLSNITKEKGGWSVIRLADEIHTKGWPVKFKVAGPCDDPALQTALQEAHMRGSLELTGPLYGPEKKAFWDSIDLFVLPSENEAEPLVVWEALLSGAPVISYARGCIPVQVGDAGRIIPIDSDFVTSSIKLIELWSTDSSLYDELAQKAVARKPFTQRMKVEQRSDFLKLLSD